MGTTLTIQEREDRERRIAAMIKKKFTQREIAEELGITTQAVSKFLALRGWKAAPANAA